MVAQLKSVPSLRDRVSPEEWALRVDLAAAYRLVALFGWDDLIFTHLSARVPGPEHHFLINSYEHMFEEMTASNLIKIDVDGNKVEDVPGIVSRQAFVAHSAIHMARGEDANAVIHLHTPHGQAVAAMEEGLMPISQTAMLVHHDLAYHDHEGLFDGLDERERIVSDIGGHNHLILRNHGTLTTGPTVGSAFLRMYFLERACEAQVLMLAAGREGLHQAPQAAIDAVKVQATNPVMAGMVEKISWAALLRKLDRIDPGYRD